VRKDSTVRFFGKWLEVHSDFTDKSIQLRYDPAEPAKLPRVFVHDQFHSDTVLLDRVRNAHRRRNAKGSEPDPQVEPTGLNPLEQMCSEHYQRTRAPWEAAADADIDKNENKED
jgi:hypothetical protein